MLLRLRITFGELTPNSPQRLRRWNNVNNYLTTLCGSGGVSSVRRLTPANTCLLIHRRVERFVAPQCDQESSVFIIKN